MYLFWYVRDLGSRTRLPSSARTVSQGTDLSEGGYTGEQVVHVDVVLPRPRKTSHKIQSDPSNLAGPGKRRLVKDESVGITVLHLVDGVDPDA
mgnify:FL=1